MQTAAHTRSFLHGDAGGCGYDSAGLEQMIKEFCSVCIENLLSLGLYNFFVVLTGFPNRI
jgi:hypothetical protein